VRVSVIGGSSVTDEEYATTEPGVAMTDWPCSPLRVTARLAPSDLRVEGAGTLRVEAADGDDHVPEPHVRLVTSFTEYTHGASSTDTWRVTTALTPDGGQSYAADLRTVASDTEHRETHYTTTPALAVRLRRETATVEVEPGAIDTDDLAGGERAEVDPKSRYMWESCGSADPVAKKQTRPTPGRLRRESWPTKRGPAVRTL
jgi:hypothetical protein